jgi:hypothetical protein
MQENLTDVRIAERLRWDVYDVEAPEMVTESCRDVPLSNSLRPELNASDKFIYSSNLEGLEYLHTRLLLLILTFIKFLLLSDAPSWSL